MNPDCPHGVDSIPSSDGKKSGICLLDKKDCWYKDCPKNKWCERDKDVDSNNQSK
jgi:hypothetical protein